MMENSHNETVNENSILTETPLGDNDKHLKIQLCVEFFKKEVKSSRTSKNTLKTSNRQEKKQLNVTISKLKNVPKLQGKNPNPFVKVRLLPDDIIHTTELQQGKSDAQYFETFVFPTENLSEKVLRVEVCDKKVTRSAKTFGKVDISLDTLNLSKPMLKWFELA
ncbi:unnamed protein product [Allacma fusca]|uniref:C2 domain-containing protein n=1 Tax=Allacma fusca TaxID=39272 RepID=A0A8J2LFZ7_9HEXA|nr:unnamed protein product [Allacma fusca]